VATLPPASTISLHPGHYPVTLFLDKSITLQAIGPGVVLDGQAGRPTLEIANPAAEVHLEGLSLASGVGALGQSGLLSIHAAAHVTAVDLEFREGRAQTSGAVLARATRLVLRACRFFGNHGDKAAALFAYQGSEVEVHDCLFQDNPGPGPAITAAGAAQVLVSHCTVLHAAAGGPALRLIGAGFVAPTVTVEDSRLEAAPFRAPVELLQGGTPAPHLVARATHFSAPIDLSDVEDRGGLRFDPPAG
jgi:hypothetical protein